MGRSLCSFIGLGQQCVSIILVGVQQQFGEESVADRDLSADSGAKNCCTAEFMAAFEGLQGRDQYMQAVRTGSAINVKEFAVDLRARLCKVWSEVQDADPREHRLKRATYHRWFASPLLPLKSETGPFRVPRYLNLDLGRHVQTNIARFRLRAHTMGVERACWQNSERGLCDKCGLQDVQDEKHALFLCNCEEVCALRAKYDHLFLGASSQTFVSLGTNGFYFSEIGNEDVTRFLEQDSNQMCFFISEIMDYFGRAGSDQQAEQSNYLAEGPNPFKKNYGWINMVKKDDFQALVQELKSIGQSLGAHREDFTAHRAETASVLATIPKLHEDLERLDRETGELRGTLADVLARVEALEGAPRPTPTPAAASSGGGMDSPLAMRWVLEGSGDAQRQREQMGVLALSAPAGWQGGHAEVAALFRVSTHTLSKQGARWCSCSCPRQGRAQRWLQYFRETGAGRETGFSARRSCTPLQQMRMRPLSRLQREVEQLGLGLNAFISKDRCELCITWHPVKEALYNGAPSATYPAYKHLLWSQQHRGFLYRENSMHCLEHVRQYAQQALFDWFCCPACTCWQQTYFPSECNAIL